MTAACQRRVERKQALVALLLLLFLFAGFLNLAGRGVVCAEALEAVTAATCHTEGAAGAEHRSMKEKAGAASCCPGIAPHACCLPLAGLPPAGLAVARSAPQAPLPEPLPLVMQEFPAAIYRPPALV